MLNLSDVIEPKMIVANEIWPKIKETLKETLEEGDFPERAIESLG